MELAVGESEPIFRYYDCLHAKSEKGVLSACPPKKEIEKSEQCFLDSGQKISS
jgi:hypothetical protein